MAKGTGLVKSKARYLKLIKTFPERADFYRDQIAKVEADIIGLGVCRRCGRPLTSEVAKARGYGNECLRQREAEELAEQSTGEASGVSSGVPGETS